MSIEASTRHALRHLVATLFHRFRVAVDGCPDAFGEFTPGDGVRTPCELVRHLTELSWLTRRCLGAFEVEAPEPLEWKGEVRRYRQSLIDLDSILQGDTVDPSGVESALHGPIADALTHIGQLALLRRLAGLALPPQRYLSADVRAGYLPLD